VVQKLDPPGVGARTMAECLLLQVAPETPHADILRVLIRDHLDDIANNRIPVIHKATKFDIPTIHDAIESLRHHLDPKPGLKFADAETQYVMPDVIVERGDDGDYTIRLTDEWVPKIRISKRTVELIKNKDLDDKVKEELRKKLQSADWLVKAVEQRRNTLLKVTRAIIDHQRPFLDLGPEHIQPLKMQQIADQVSVHVTTVSRAVDDKWAQTPRGVFPLKRFFGGGKKNDQTHEDVAYEVMKQKLMELVSNEDKANPLSDEELVTRLNEAGYPVARRTVTKYRKMLKIPSSRQRKDWSLSAT
jgi:RNA polymerase sigma-54 factor